MKWFFIRLVLLFGDSLVWVDEKGFSTAFLNSYPGGLWQVTYAKSTTYPVFATGNERTFASAFVAIDMFMRLGHGANNKLMVRSNI